MEVLGIPVSSLSSTDLVSRIAEGSKAIDEAYLAFALHVGGLLEAAENEAFRAIMKDAGLVYADGAAVTLLARRNGGRIGRHPTTDLGHALIRALKSRQPERTLRVALLGGPPGLAESAGATLQSMHEVHIVFSSTGYFQDDSMTLLRLRDSEPDIVFVGLGAPREMVWTTEHKASLPACPIVTCGGWFGFLAGEEHRAPQFLQRSGMEWAWRLGQAPKRLFSRYFRGGLLVVRELISPHRFDSLG